MNLALKEGGYLDCDHYYFFQGLELSGRPIKVPKRRLKETKFYVKGDYYETKSGAMGDLKW